MQVRKLVLIICTVVLIFENLMCNQNTKMANNYNVNYLDTLKGISWLVGKNDSFEYKYLKNLALKHSLDQIYSGYNGLEVRIWFEYKIQMSHLVIIKLNKIETSICLFILDYKDDKNNLHQEITATPTILTDKAQVIQIVQKLDSLNLFTLPSYDKIPNGPEELLDPVYYVVEIAIKNKYRYYEYEAPEQFKDRFWQCSNFDKILNYLERKLNFKRNLN